MITEKISIEEKEKFGTIIKIKGDFTPHVRDDIQTFFQSFSEHVERNVVIDLNESSFIDSAGIGLIVNLYKTMEKKGYILDVINISSQPASIMKFLALDKFVNLSFKKQ